MRTLGVLSLMVCLAAGGVPSIGAAEPMKPSGVMEVVMSDDPADFYESAASINQFEIDASLLAQDKSKNADVQAFADTMVKDHSEAAQKLANLATSKNVELPTQLLKRHQMMLDGLREKGAGPAFDEDYRTKMVLSHKEAVSLFDQSAKESPDPDIRKFALSRLTKLKAHGAHAQKLEDAAGSSKQ